MKRTIFAAWLLVIVTATWVLSQQPVTLSTQLDPANDGVRVYGSDDGGTTKRIVKTTAGGTTRVAAEATTTGGWTPYRLLSAATTNSTSIKGSAGTLAGVQATNTNAEERYVIFYNTATAPTCTAVGTATPTYAIPGATTGGGTNIPLPPGGIAFGTGIGVCITTGSDGTGSVAAGEIILNLQYQ